MHAYLSSPLKRFFPWIRCPAPVPTPPSGSLRSRPSFHICPPSPSLSLWPLPPFLTPMNPSAPFCCLLCSELAVAGLDPPSPRGLHDHSTKVPSFLLLFISFSVAVVSLASLESKAQGLEISRSDTVSGVLVSFDLTDEHQSPRRSLSRLTGSKAIRVPMRPPIHDTKDRFWDPEESS